jgi:hypothetical protein
MPANSRSIDLWAIAIAEKNQTHRDDCQEVSIREDKYQRIKTRRYISENKIIIS